MKQYNKEIRIAIIAPGNTTEPGLKLLLALTAEESLKGFDFGGVGNRLELQVDTLLSTDREMPTSYTLVLYYAIPTEQRVRVQPFFVADPDEDAPKDLENTGEYPDETRVRQALIDGLVAKGFVAPTEKNGLEEDGYTADLNNDPYC